MQKTIREALGVAVTDKYKNSTKEELFRSERDLISKDRREVDLVSVLSKGSQSFVLQVETKSADMQNTSKGYLKRDMRKGVEQLEHFKDYLQRMHGSEASKFYFLPALALPNMSNLSLKHILPNQEEKFGQYCAKHFLLSDHKGSPEQLELWWQANCEDFREGNVAAISDSLTMQLLTVASMVFTRIPHFLSRDTPDSILILLR